MKKHINIPVFIPHYGCPNACVFCNQKKITGKSCYDEDAVISEIENALKTIDTENTETELAFFGGSFTAIPENEMLGLLSISDRFLKSGKIKSVRISTRPDAISGSILHILKSHGVKTVELGIQSFSDRVLTASKRGHTAAASENACKLIKNYGFSLIGQMMVGLPCSDYENELRTAEKICLLGCDGARIYPTVVFPDTELMKMRQSGLYTPLTNEEAIRRTSGIIGIFAENSVPVIRIGLCSNETLEDSKYADDYHPSIGELAINRYYFIKMRKLLEQSGQCRNKTAFFCVAKGKISQAIGQKRINAETLIKMFELKDLKVKENYSLLGFELSLTIS